MYTHARTIMDQNVGRVYFFLLNILLAQQYMVGVAITVAEAANVTSLKGTWASKSWAVFTGPDFYDPTNDRLLEPRLPGSSFSFTDDGYFEEAIYVAIANPTEPSCPTAVLQFQHGNYHIAANGSIVLYPIAEDGRQLLSDPCKYENSVYGRYNATEVFREIITDGYRTSQGTTAYRLNLWKHDGAPMNPLYLADTVPNMNPTIPLNAPVANTSDKRRRRRVAKREVDELEKMGFAERGKDYLLEKMANVQPESVKWIGVGLTLVGSLGLWAGVALGV